MISFKEDNFVNFRIYRGCICFIVGFGLVCCILIWVGFIDVGIGVFIFIYKLFIFIYIYKKCIVLLNIVCDLMR